MSLMKHFVIQGPTNRRVFLEQHLNERGVTDVEWIDGMNTDSQLVQWLGTSCTLPLGQISCSIKHFWALSEMVRRGITEAVIFEDDVVLCKDFNKWQRGPGFVFQRLCIGVNWHLKPGLEPVEVGNLGGSEAYYVHVDFARFVLDRVNFDHSIDLVLWACAMEMRHPLVCVPVAHQTSILEGTSSTGNAIMNCRTFLQTWGSLPKFRWSDLMKEFNKIPLIEAEFERNFGKKVRIINSEYIKAFYL